MRDRRATLKVKNTPLSSTPTVPPSARLAVKTVTTTVATMTALDIRGWTTTARSDDQSKVSIETITMIATSAATGTSETHGFRSTIRISRNAPVAIMVMV